MNKKQLAILEKAWDAQISCALKEQALPIIQINHHGIAAYCSHLPDDVDIDEMEREMKQ